MPVMRECRRTNILMHMRELLKERGNHLQVEKCVTANEVLCKKCDRPIAPGEEYHHTNNRPGSYMHISCVHYH